MIPRRTPAQLSVRLRFHDEARIGPGKIALLEAVAATGSVMQAGARMEMSARRAWRLIESLNNAFEEPVVTRDESEPQDNDRAAQLTPFGHALVAAYRAVEVDTQAAVETRFAAIVQRLRNMNS